MITSKPAIAQLVEHLTVETCSNQMVPGSIPGGRICSPSIEGFAPAGARLMSFGVASSSPPLSLPSSPSLFAPPSFLFWGLLGVCWWMFGVCLCFWGVVGQVLGELLGAAGGC